jgi:hypothetical protein
MGAIHLERLCLQDATQLSGEMHQYLDLDRHWRESSPLRRAAAAVIAHWESRGIDPGTAHLHGQDVRDRETPYFAGFDLRYLRALPRCLTEHHGVEWIEVIHPTKTLPLECLKITPRDSNKLRDQSWS